MSGHLYLRHMIPANGPELDVYAQHHQCWKQEGDAGGEDGVLGGELQRTVALSLEQDRSSLLKGLTQYN